jgi:hypothetical protein
MKFVVEVEDFYLEEEDLNAGLASTLLLSFLKMA